MTREDVVQAALMIERYCEEHFNAGMCDCPFADGICCEIHSAYTMPYNWNLEIVLRNRGLKHEQE